MGILMWWRRTEEVVNFVQDYLKEKKGERGRVDKEGNWEILKG